MKQISEEINYFKYCCIDYISLGAVDCHLLQTVGICCQPPNPVLQLRRILDS